MGIFGFEGDTMKTSARLIITLTSVLAFTGMAQATVFTVSNTSLTPTYNVSSGGNSTDFIWSVLNSVASSKSITGGNSATFTYGTFSTSDFPISNNDLRDYLNNTIGTFTASFMISPPTPGALVSLAGIPKVTGSIKTRANGNGEADDAGVYVDFNNSPILETFGNGGQYSVIFNDSASITRNGTYDLTATIKLNADSIPAPSPAATVAPVPEPGTMVLLGAGFLCLAIYGKRRRNA
jgi:hypothetical protein